MRGILTDLGVTDGLEIHHDADLPARSGLGSSSSFTVGLLNALNALNARMISKRDLGREAIRIEQEVLKEDVGCQDQIWAAYGGFNRIDFHQDGTFSVMPFILPPARRTELSQSLMLFFTGFSRFATDFAQDQIKNMNSRKNQLRMIRSLVDSAADISARSEDAAARARRADAPVVADQARARRRASPIRRSTTSTRPGAMPAPSAASSWAPAAAASWCSWSIRRSAPRSASGCAS